MTTSLPRYSARATWGDRLLALEAAGWLLLAFLLVRCLPFRYYARLLGRAARESDQSLSPRKTMSAARLRWAVQSAHTRVPWRCTCLMRSMAARWMLTLRHIPCTLYLGVAVRDRVGAMAAHAWLRAGEHVLIGAAAAPRVHRIVGFS